MTNNLVKPIDNHPGIAFQIRTLTGHNHAGNATIAFLVATDTDYLKGEMEGQTFTYRCRKASIAKNI
ncbi:hypothetical protein VTL71DRAFT_10964 [Oculimacula yallundae]|uniref:Uncharacterized protein n=1 Tax=Oculimacula yallundae TaxID=86028 RepID=A0ABR4CUH9_9HELO